MKSKSDLGYFAFVHLYDCFLELFHSFFTEVELTFMSLRQSMGIAKYKCALALCAQ